MSVRIHISYTRDEEAALLMDLLKPVAHEYKVRKAVSGQRKHVYYIPRARDKA